MIMFYFDAEGREPTSLPPEIEGFSKMKYRGNYDESVPMHILVSDSKSNFLTFEGICRKLWRLSTLSLFALSNEHSLHKLTSSLNSHQT